MRRLVVDLKAEYPAFNANEKYWTVDVRYLKGLRLGGRAYVIAVLENHSRAIVSSAVTRSQDLASFLSVLYAAVERYGSPEALVTDGGGSSGRGRRRPSTRPSG